MPVSAVMCTTSCSHCHALYRTSSYIAFCGLLQLQEDAEIIDREEIIRLGKIYTKEHYLHTSKELIKQLSRSAYISLAT